MDLSKINRKMLAALKNHNAAVLGNYYQRRVEAEQMFDAYDRDAIDFIVGHCNSQEVEVIEVAAGIGQLAIALDLLGFWTTAFEVGPRMDIGRAVAEELKSGAGFIRCDWRQPQKVNRLFEWKKNHVVVTINAVNALLDLHKDEAVLLKVLDAGAMLIFDPSRYGKQGDLCPPSIMRHVRQDIRNNLACFRKEEFA